MSEVVSIRLKKETIEKLKELAKKKNKSRNELLQEIITNFIEKGVMDIKIWYEPKFKLMKAPFDVPCSTHKQFFGAEKTIKKGEDVLWLKGTNVNICMDCIIYLARDSLRNIDSKILKKGFDAYKKYLQYKALVNEAKKELENLTALINFNIAIQKIFDIEKKLLEHKEKECLDYSVYKELISELEEIRGALYTIRDKMKQVTKTAEKYNIQLPEW